MKYTFRPMQQWPRAFTKNRQRSRFDSTYSQTLELLERELNQLNARNVVIQLALTDADIRRDGLPRADRQPTQPGVIVSFEKIGKWIPATQKYEIQALSFPCDAFTSWKDNLRAIALALEALRKVDRYGVTSTGEQYTGWAALPAASAGVLTVEEAAAFIAQSARTQATPRDLLDSGQNFQMVHRIAMRKLHPDAGGDTAEFQKLQQAADILKKHHGI